jgi:hypothetical protein
MAKALAGAPGLTWLQLTMIECHDGPPRDVAGVSWWSLTEKPRANDRVQTVSSDQEVTADRPAVGEASRDRGGLLFHRRAVGAKPNNASPQSLEQRMLQIRAVYAHRIHSRVRTGGRFDKEPSGPGSETSRRTNRLGSNGLADAKDIQRAKCIRPQADASSDLPQRWSALEHLDTAACMPQRNSSGKTAYAAANDDCGTGCGHAQRARRLKSTAARLA